MSETTATIDSILLTTVNNSLSLLQLKPSSRGLDYYLWVYVSPLVFFLGLLGNTLSIAVLHGRTFKHTTTAVYLPTIAVADSIVLLTGLLVEWLEWTQIRSVKESSIWGCRFHKVLFYSSGDASIWLIVAFTFDRFIAVCFPLSKRRVCAPRRSLVVSVTIVVLSFAKNFHEFWTRGAQYDPVTGQLVRRCGYPDQFYYFQAFIRPWVAFAVITALPFLLILVFNCLIVHCLIRAQRMRAQAVAATGNTSSTSGFKQTTLMCLSVSFAFLVCIAPSVVLLIGKPYWTANRRTNLAYDNAKAINNLLVYVNHSINFVLYCVSGRRFRDELVVLLVKLFCWCPRWSTCSTCCPQTSAEDAGTKVTMLNGAGNTTHCTLGNTTVVTKPLVAARKHETC